MKESEKPDENMNVTDVPNIVEGLGTPMTLRSGNQSKNQNNFDNTTAENNRYKNFNNYNYYYTTEV